MGASIAGVGTACMLVLALAHYNGVSGPLVHDYFTLATRHPFRIMQIFWDARTDIIANLAPGGLVGIGVPLIIPIALGVIVPDTLAGTVLAEPLFQNVPLYVFLPVGTVIVIAWLLRRHRRTAFVLTGVAAAQAIGWAAIWGPQIPVQWLRVSSSQATTLASVQCRIPASAEVIVSHGVLGRFTERTHVYPLSVAGVSLPLRPDTWVVITPTAGIEKLTPATGMALIGELAGPLHARLVTHANGVWAFQISPLPGMTKLWVPGPAAPLPAWAGAGVASRPVLDGAVSDWHMAATGAKGYVSAGLEWLEKPGRYRAAVTLSASASASGAPVNVEVWDNNNNALLARRAVTSTDGIQEIVMPITAPAAPSDTVFRGWGPFRAQFASPPPGQRIEVRVWSPGGAAVNVYSADLTTDSGSTPDP